MSTFTDFEEFYEELAEWCKARHLTVTPGALLTAAAVLSISEMERKGWGLRRDEMRKATRAAEAAKAAIVKEFGGA